MSRLLFVLCAVLGGCAIGPDYVRPSIDTPATYRFEPASTTQTANTDWWRQFDEPVLDQMILEALAHNWNVLIAAANVERAAGVLTTTRSALYPQVSYQAEGTRQRSSESGAGQAILGGPNPFDRYQVLAGASWEIDLWGRVRRLTEAARADLLASNEARRGAVLSVVATVASTYLQLISLDSQLAISKRTLETYAQSVSLFELQFKYGVVSQINVEQARSQYETAAAQIPGIELRIAQMENGLSILLGRNPGSIARGKAIDALTLPTIPAALPSQLLEQRPDILQAEQQLVAANANIGAAKALYFPTISLTGAYGRASVELNNLFNGPARAWNFGGSIAGPIFTAGSITGQVRQAEALQQANLLSYRQTVQSAFADVENALVATTKLGEQVAAQERLVSALTQYSLLARLQFDGGVVPYSTVLQAEQQLFPTELTLAALRAQLLTSRVSVYQATGGGWVDGHDRQTLHPIASSPPIGEQVRDDLRRSD